MTDFPRGDPENHILSLLSGKWVSQAVSAAANLGISDVLGAEALSVGELARRLDCHEDMLRRLLLVLVGEGLYDLSEDGETVRATPAGQLLGTGPESLKDLAAFVGSPAQWAPWSALAEGIRKGCSAYEATHGESLYQWLDNNPDDAKLYDQGIDGFTAGIGRNLAERHDFADVRTIVDVGGGIGGTLAAILNRWPSIQGVLVDRPQVLDRAQAHLRRAGVAGRCRFEGRDFFDPLPTGGNVYLVKHVLHNWGDEDAIRILRRCREAVAPGGRLLVVEGVLFPAPGRNMSRLMDLEMMVLFGIGKSRTKQAFKSLMKRGGWVLEHTTVPLSPFARLLVAREGRQD